MATYGYLRVSTGESLAVQRRQIEGYATMIGVAAPQVFIEEGVSGTKPLAERPAGKALLDSVRSGDVIICAKLDRMFRSALDALQMVNAFKAKSVSLHLIDLGGDVSGNGISKLFFTIVSAVAEAERDRIAARVLEVKRDQRSRGRHLGGKRPFGFQVLEDGSLVEDASEQAAIRKIVEMRKAGMTLRAMQEALAKEGFAISHVGIDRILKRAG